MPAPSHQHIVTAKTPFQTLLDAVASTDTTRAGAAATPTGDTPNGTAPVLPHGGNGSATVRPAIPKGTAPVLPSLPHGGNGSAPVRPSIPTGTAPVLPSPQPGAAKVTHSHKGTAPVLPPTTGGTTTVFPHRLHDQATDRQPHKGTAPVLPRPRRMTHSPQRQHHGSDNPTNRPHRERQARIYDRARKRVRFGNSSTAPHSHSARPDPTIQTRTPPADAGHKRRRPNHNATRDWKQPPRAHLLSQHTHLHTTTTSSPVRDPRINPTQTEPITIPHKPNAFLNMQRAILTDNQSKYPAQTNTRNPLMWHRDLAKDHPAFNLLLQYARDGCPVECGPAWPIARMQAAIDRGNHPTARTAQATTALRLEIKEKVEQGYARIVSWHDIKNKPPHNLKISPLAAIPHKSRAYRAILDLSYQMKIAGQPLPSINDNCDKDLAPQITMKELGKVLPRLIAAIANASYEEGPIQLAKLDIKDGYWRVSVPTADAWNFAYLLPPTSPTDPPQLVIPNSLQMGWSESPPYFCAVSETVRDIAETEAAKDPHLPPHKFEHHMLPQVDTSQLTAKALDFLTLLEVYVDDFIALAQSTDPQKLLHLSRSLLHSIHSLFPPPEVTGHDAPDPISEKKLKDGDGIWQTKKEILGWIFDGVSRCIQLPTDKVTSILTELKAVHRQKVVSHKTLEKLFGKLSHAAFGIPAGRSLCAPIIRTLKRQKQLYKVTANLKLALRDWSTIIKLSLSQPTWCRDLVPDTTDYYGCCDASGEGAGGIWFGHRCPLQPLVWRVEWPDEIRARLVSWKNPKGTITNSDLELAGLLLQWLALECTTDVHHKHVLAWGDNTPTVSWATRMSCSSSLISGRLLRALALRQRLNEASPIVTHSIAGEKNTLADVASRPSRMPTHNFLHNFNNKFPLPQRESWRQFHFPSKLVSRVCGELLMTQSTLGWWHRITLKGHVTGEHGKHSSAQSESPISTSNIRPHTPPPTSYSPLPPRSDWENGAKAGKSKLRACRTRFVPSARLPNWMATQIPSIESHNDTTSGSNG